MKRQRRVPKAQRAKALIALASTRSFDVIAFLRKHLIEAAKP
jgi:hypothetical protein